MIRQSRIILDFPKHQTVLSFISIRVLTLVRVFDTYAAKFYCSHIHMQDAYQQATNVIRDGCEKKRERNSFGFVFATHVDSFLRDFP